MEEFEAYIEILRYGSKLETVDPQTLIEYLNEREIYVNPGQPNAIHFAKFRNIFSLAFQDSQGNRPNLNNTGNAYHLKLEALGQLYNYEALEQAKADSQKARDEARQAIKIANRSFYLAMVVGIVQIILAIVAFTNKN
ncbi:hypothetical protein [Mucilaginibacter sp. AK015]|uniref:hypothetical protein n=1 Tax=Mucilaginibacter sp. AK015 TaxID=2723072 RepID=UPI001607E1FB|nr:hypothetical protein [Mucilaginibacter sp. AK015]MBB5395058.1 hypothetical protein [Mucilaginibacter sp. AK015]